MKESLYETAKSILMNEQFTPEIESLWKKPFSFKGKKIKPRVDNVPWQIKLTFDGIDNFVDKDLHLTIKGQPLDPNTVTVNGDRIKVKKLYDHIQGMLNFYEDVPEQ